MIPEGLKMRAIGRAKLMGISFGEFTRESLERALQFPAKEGSIHLTGILNMPVSLIEVEKAATEILFTQRELR